MKIKSVKNNLTKLEKKDVGKIFIFDIYIQKNINFAYIKDGINIKYQNNIILFDIIKTQNLYFRTKKTNFYKKEKLFIKNEIELTYKKNINNINMENACEVLEDNNINQTNLKISPIIKERPFLDKKGNINQKKEENIKIFNESKNNRIKSENKKKD